MRAIWNEVNMLQKRWSEGESYGVNLSSEQLGQGRIALDVLSLRVAVFQVLFQQPLTGYIPRDRVWSQMRVDRSPLHCKRLSRRRVNSLAIALVTM